MPILGQLDARSYGNNQTEVVMFTLNPFQEEMEQGNMLAGYSQNVRIKMCVIFTIHKCSSDKGKSEGSSFKDKPQLTLKIKKIMAKRDKHLNKFFKTRNLDIEYL